MISGYNCKDCREIWNQEPIHCPACGGTNVDGGPPQADAEGSKSSPVPSSPVLEVSPPKALTWPAYCKVPARAKYEVDGRTRGWIVCEKFTGEEVACCYRRDLAEMVCASLNAAVPKDAEPSSLLGEAP